MIQPRASDEMVMRVGWLRVGVKMVDGSLERPGATLFLCHELCHSAASDGDQGELGGDKEKEAIWPTSRRCQKSCDVDPDAVSRGHRHLA
jgi:hypothetical protein